MSENIKIASRMRHIHPFYVMELLARCKTLEAQGRSVVHMEVGEPDFVTPEPIIRAGQRALQQGHTHYSPATGIPKLREAIADFYLDRYGVHLDPGRVLVTPGASGALQLVMSVLIDPGDEVLMADPGYPCNRHFVHLVGGIPVSIPVGADTEYQLSAASVSAAWTPKTKAVLVASPSNPTGTLLSLPELKAIHQVVRDRGGVLIVDEIYQGLVYDGDRMQTALAIADDIFVINSFSKYFGMTGWRLGWLVAPKSCVATVDRLAQNIFLAASTPTQHAALAAFTPETLDILEQRRRAFAERRDYLLPALRSLGFKILLTPRGAFYLYADCSSLTKDSFGFATELLEKEGVAVTPGRDFGQNRPEQHLRFAYTTEISQLQEGVARLARFLGKAA